MPTMPTPGTGPRPPIAGAPIASPGTGGGTIDTSTQQTAIKSRIGGIVNAKANQPMGPRPTPAAGNMQKFQALKSAAGDMRNNTSMVKAKVMGTGAAPVAAPMSGSLNALKSAAGNMKNNTSMVRHQAMGTGSAPMNGSLHAGQFGKVAGAALSAGVAGPIGMAVGAMMGGGNKSSLGASVAKPGMGMMQPLPRKF